MINFIKDKGLNVYIVGYGSEKFSDGNKIFSVDLKDWTTLMNHEKCKLCLTTLSGPAYLMCFFSNENGNKVVIDITNERSYASKNRLNLDVINFRKAKINYFDFLPLKLLENYIK